MFLRMNNLSQVPHAIHSLNIMKNSTNESNNSETIGAHQKEETFPKFGAENV